MELRHQSITTEPDGARLLYRGEHSVPAAQALRHGRKEDGFIVNDTLSICKYVTVVRSFKTKTSFSLIVVMMCNVLSPCDYLYDTFDLFLSRVKCIAEREYPEDKPSGNAVDTFLHDLLLGRESNEAIIRERCKLVGIPPEARFCLFAIPVTEDMSPSRLLSDLVTMVGTGESCLFRTAASRCCASTATRSARAAGTGEVGSRPRGHNPSHHASTSSWRKWTLFADAAPSSRISRRSMPIDRRARGCTLLKVKPCARCRRFLFN